MKARPILFSAEMVRALLDGTKTQTRRVMKPQPSVEWEPFSYDEVHKMVNGAPDEERIIGWGACNENGDEAWPCPYGKPGDLLWVREAWAPRRVDKVPHKVIYRVDHPLDKTVPGQYGRSWKPSIHMPRWANRITLEITDVRVARLQDISEEDALEEGIEAEECLNGEDTLYNDYSEPKRLLECPIESYRTLWQSLHGAESWNANPWVWVIEFKVHQCNVDEAVF